jgi:hypothetical protein
MPEQELKLRITAKADEAKQAINDLRSSIGNNFADINRVGTASLRGLQAEVTSFVRQVPIVGTPLASITRELLNIGSASKKVDETTAAFARFKKVLAEISIGNNPTAGAELKNLGIDAAQALRAPEAAYAQFTAGLLAMKTAEGEVATATNVLGSAVASDLVPALASAEASATGAGGAIAALASPLGFVVGGVVAVSAAMLAADAVAFKLSESYAQQGRQISLLSEQTGLSTENVSALHVGMALIGKDFESLSSPLNIYLKNLAEVAHGNTALSATFKRFGIDAKDAKEALKDPNKAIEGLIKLLGSIQSPADRADAAMKLAGRGARDLALLADSANGSLDELRKTAANLGVSFSEKDAADAREFTSELALLKLQVEGVGYSIARQVMPDIEAGLKSLSEYVKENRSSWTELGGELRDFVTASAPVISALGTIAGEVVRLIDLAAKPIVIAVQIKRTITDGSTAELPFAGSYFSRALDYTRNLLSRDDKQLSNFGYDAPTHVATSAEVARAAEESRKVNQPPRPSTVGDVAHKARGGGKSQKDEEQKLELESLKLFNKEVEDVTRTNREILEREYRLGIRDLDEYVKQGKADNEAHYHDQLDAFTREEEIAREHIKNKRELELKLRAVQLERDNALDAKRKEDQRLDDERIQKQQARELALNKQLADIRASMREGERARIEESQRAGVTSEWAAQRQLYNLLSQGFEDRKTLLEMELKQAYLTLDKKTEIGNALIKLDQDRTNAAEDAARRITDALMREARSNAALSLDPKSVVTDADRRREKSGNLLSKDQLKALGTDPVPDYSAHMHAIDAFRSFSLDAFHGITDGFGSMLQAFLAGGDISGKAFLAMAKGVIAGLAAQAFVKMVFEIAEGYAALANPITAPLAPMHFAAAKFYGIVSALGAVAALAIPGGKGASTATGGAAFASAASSNPTPNNQTFNYGNSTQPSSAVATQGSGNIWRDKRDAALDRLNATLDRIQGIPASHVVALGAHDARAEIGVAFVNHTGENGALTDQLARNLRVA